MRGRKRQQTAADLSRAAARFTQWRQSRARGARIPAGLWKLALDLVGRHGLCPTATALKLDYYSLKKRLAARPLPTVNTGHPNSPAAFVELAPAVVASPGQCLIEFAHRAGSVLRVYLPAGQAPDLVALGRSFWDAP